MDFIIENNRLCGYIGKSENVIIPDGITEIEESAFEDSPIKHVVVPDSVTKIGEMAFYNCDLLETVSLSEGLIEIGDGAFSGCESLKEIRIPDSVTGMGESVFENCESLREVVFSRGMTVINACMFDSCDSLSSVTIPDNITLIDDSTFEDFIGLTIKCNPGSFAESWAMNHEFITVPIMSKMRLALDEADAEVNSPAPGTDSIER